MTTLEMRDTKALCEVLESRAVFYEMLAALYFKPLTQQQIDAMANTDFSAYASINREFSEGIENITRYLRKRNTGTRQELAVDFTSAFIGTKVYEGKTAVPYKSVFTSEEGLLYQQGHKDVFALYKKESVKKRDGLDFPDDHLSFMCEFLALLSRRTAVALSDGDWSKSLKNIELSLDFLDTHILSWFESFTCLANTILTTRFYRGVLEITQGYFNLEIQTLIDLKEEVKSYQE